MTPTGLVKGSTGSLLGERNLEGHLWCDHEALQAMLCDARLQLISVLNECDIASLDQSGLLESRILSEKHGQHHLIDLWRQVLNEEHIGWLSVLLATLLLIVLLFRRSLRWLRLCLWLRLWLGSSLWLGFL